MCLIEQNLLGGMQECAVYESSFATVLKVFEPGTTPYTALPSIPKFPLNDSD